MQQVSPQPRCFNFVLKNILVRTLSQRVPLIETIGNQGSWLIQQQVWRAGVFLPLCCSYSAKQTVHLQSKGDSNCKLIPDVREPRISPVCFLEACRHFQKKKKAVLSIDFNDSETKYQYVTDHQDNLLQCGVFLFVSMSTKET